MKNQWNFKILVLQLAFYCYNSVSLRYSVYSEMFSQSKVFKAKLDTDAKPVFKTDLIQNPYSDNGICKSWEIARNSVETASLSCQSGNTLSSNNTRDKELALSIILTSHSTCRALKHTWNSNDLGDQGSQKIIWIVEHLIINAIPQKV